MGKTCTCIYSTIPMFSDLSGVVITILTGFHCLVLGMQAVRWSILLAIYSIIYYSDMVTTETFLYLKVIMHVVYKI